MSLKASRKGISSLVPHNIAYIEFKIQRYLFIHHLVPSMNTPNHSFKKSECLFAFECNAFFLTGTFSSKYF